MTSLKAHEELEEKAKLACSLFKECRPESQNRKEQADATHHRKNRPIFGTPRILNMLVSHTNLFA